MVIQSVFTDTKVFHTSHCYRMQLFSCWNYGALPLSFTSTNDTGKLVLQVH